MKDSSPCISQIILLGNYIKSKNSWGGRRLPAGTAKPPRVTELGEAIDCGTVFKFRLRWMYYATLRKDTLDSELYVHTYICFMCTQWRGHYFDHIPCVSMLIVNFKFNPNKSLKRDFQGIKLSRLEIFNT